MRRKLLLLSAVSLALLPATSKAVTTYYSQNFDSDDSANWNFFSSLSGDTASNTEGGLGTANGSGGGANFFYNYSSVGIPSAPGSGGSTRGLQVQTNLPGTGTFHGVSVSPKTLALPSVYHLSFYMWENTVGPFPGGGSGSTQLGHVTVGSKGTATEFAGSSISGIQFSYSTDGGTNPDIRAYTGQMPHGAGGVLVPGDVNTSDSSHVYDAGTATGTGGATDNTNSYYSFLSNGSNVAPPQAQKDLYASQTGNVASGVPSFIWRHWEVYKDTDFVTWVIDGKEIARVGANFFPSDFSGANLAFGFADINPTSSTDTNATALQFGLIDNIVVDDAVPEPSSLALVAGAGLLLARRRRRSR